MKYGAPALSNKFVVQFRDIAGVQREQLVQAGNGKEGKTRFCRADSERYNKRYSVERKTITCSFWKVMMLLGVAGVHFVTFLQTSLICMQGCLV